MNRAPVVEELPPESVFERLRVPLIRKAHLVRQGHEEDVLTIDIGIRGVFVERAEPLPVNERIAVEFSLPENALPVKAVCRVAWCHAPGTVPMSRPLPAGIGLQFLEIDAADLERVRAHVTAYCRRHPKARQFYPNWPEDAEGPWPTRP